MADTRYLQRKGNAYMVVVEVPKEKREAVGKPRFKRSLGAVSLAEANRKKLAIVAQFHAQIDEAMKRKGDPIAALLRDGASWKTELATAKTHVERDDEGREWVERDELLSTIKDQARLIAELHGRIIGDRYLEAATGEGNVIDTALLESWIVECDDTGQTKSQHKSTVKRFLTWAGDLPTIQSIDRVKAGQYVTELLTASGLARKTIKRHLSSLSSFWQWLDSKGTPKCANVWVGHKLGKVKLTRARKGLDDEKITRILKGSYTTERYRQTIHDLTRLALLQGARLDELCSVKKADVHKRSDGLWIVIGGGKTEAAARELPVHPLAVPVVERLLKGTGDEFLFEGLMPGGPDGKRSWYVSKAYGRFRKQKDVNVPDRLEDFHALRNTFIEVIEGADVAESTTKLLVGHKRQSMTYGHYSKGQRVNLRKAIERLEYAAEVTAAF